MSLSAVSTSAMRPTASAVCRARIAGLVNARSTFVMLAAAALARINPLPAVGHGETIGYRTAMFMAMLLISIGAAALATFLRHRYAKMLGGWNATLIGGGAFLIVIVAAMLALPGINEVPDAFPAALLWHFRIASIGTQAVLWASIGLAFGALTDRSLTRS